MKLIYHHRDERTWRSRAFIARRPMAGLVEFWLRPPANDRALGRHWKSVPFFEIIFFSFVYAAWDDFFFLFETLFLENNFILSNSWTWQKYCHWWKIFIRVIRKYIRIQIFHLTESSRFQSKNKNLFAAKDQKKIIYTSKKLFFQRLTIYKNNLLFFLIINFIVKYCY